jgi:ribosomal protein S18 acetylase RimI-like enzyme
MRYRIRAALADDSPQLAALMGELGYPTTREFVQEKLAQLSSIPGTKIFVADYDGKVVGLLSFSILPLLHLEGGLGRITALVVASQFKGRGIGKRLVAEAESFAWNNRCARIEITSGEHRAAAHAFYEAVGYKQDSRRFVKTKPISPSE